MIGNALTTLGAAIDAHGGSLKTGPFGTALKAREYSRTGVPVISVGEIGGGILRVTENTPRVDTNVTHRLAEYILRQGDIVFARKGAVDRCARIQDHEDGYFLGSDGIRLRTGDWVDARFLAYQLQSEHSRSWLLQNASGTTMASLNQEILRALPLNLPNASVQVAVGEALSDADALIAGLERMIAKKEAIKQGMMQQLLTGRTRLPGFTATWNPTRLGEVLSFQVGFPFRSDFFNVAASRGVRLIRNRDLKSDDTAIFYTGEFRSEYLVCDGDVLVGMDGDFAPCLWTGGEALLNQRVGRVLARRCSTEFIYFAVRDHLAKLESRTGATTVKHLSHRDVESITMPMPGIDEQHAIASALIDADYEINALGFSLAKARAIKQGMMQQLLTGRIRLPIEEKSWV